MLFPYNIYLSGKLEFKGTVRLGDIGRIENAKNKKIISSKLVVNNLESPVYISSEILSQKLKAGMPEKLDRIYGRGIWLIPVTRVYDHNKLEKILFKQLNQLKGAKNILPGLSINIPEAVRFNLPEKGVSYKFRLPSHARSLTPGQRIVALDVFSLDKKKEFLLRRQVKVDIREWIQVAVSKRDLIPGSTIKKSDYHLEKRAVYSGKKDFVAGNITGRKVMASIPQGTDLTVKNLQHVHTVRKGQRVALVMQSPGLILKIKSIAQKNGEPGDLIPVRVLLPGGRFGNQMRARVMDEQQVVVDGTKL